MRSAAFDRSVDVTYPYFGLCVFAAGAANSQTIWFYGGLLLIAAWALWLVKPKTTRIEVWVLILAVAAVIGYAGQLGLHALQGTVEGKFASLVPGSGSGVASNVRNTAIGSIGTLKLSGRIVMRVTAEAGQAPQLLHTATFTSYAASQWMAASRGSKAFEPTAGGRAWDLAASGKESARAKLATSLIGLPAWLPLPDRTVRIEAAQDMALRRDPYGAVQVEEGPSLATYDVSFRPGPSTDIAPENSDLFVPAANRPVLAKVVDELKLASLAPRDRVNAVAAYFQNNFTYSLYQPDRDPQSDPLEYFLTKTRAGHCEYFATSTVLLLRAAGVPARYSIGYSVQEWSPREQAYIVRDRHAHAWSRVYVDGDWMDVDTTPASWANIEAARASRWQSAEDFLSWSWYAFRQWQAAHVNGWIASAAMWLLLPLAVILLWSFRFLWIKRAARAVPEQEALPVDGVDSDFYRIELVLEKAGFGRRATESMKSWIERLENHSPAAIGMDALRPLLALHYRYRFDPQGLRTQDRARLKLLTESWLAQHAHLRTKVDKLRAWFSRQ